MLRVPKNLSPKLRQDPYMLHNKYISSWIEIKKLIEKMKKKHTLLKVLYNPDKNNKVDFIEELAISID